MSIASRPTGRAEMVCRLAERYVPLKEHSMRKSAVYAFPALCMIAMLTSCATNNAVIQDSTLNAENSATLVVYRPNTSFHKANPSKPSVYVDGEKLGTLGINRSLRVQLPMGSHVITVKRPFLFMPVFSAGKVSVTIDQPRTYYVRYSYDFTGFMASPGGNASATGSSSLMLVDEAMGKNKQ